MIYDLSEIQKRKPNPQVKLVSQVLWKDGSAAQHTINVKIRGKPYVIFVDEGGSGGGTSAAQLDGACAAGLPLFPMARIIDVANESKPKIVSPHHDRGARSRELRQGPSGSRRAVDLHLRHALLQRGQPSRTRRRSPAACSIPASACSTFATRCVSKEIAYYNPAGTTTVSKGSNHTLLNNWVAGGPDWCSAQVHLDAKKGTLWTTCQDNGVLTLKFRHGVWPFPESSTPDGEQN